ncbi:MAG: hypothetical protein NC177_03785 [Ruminococcus flavefaciens]|nr:hypothetical protein [Ruminococcus flavefaciens]
MDKNELKNDIKNALEDLKDDYTNYAQKYDDFQDINSNKADLPKNLMMTELWHYSAHSDSEYKRASEDSLEKHFSKDELEKMGIHSRKASSEYADGYALFKVLFPHIAGFVIGCAVARICTFGFAGYMIFGVIFAFLVGVHKSTYDDQITLKYAVIKNIVLIVIEIVIILLFAGIYGIIYMTG